METTLTSLDDGETYTFQVRAVNSSNNGVISDEFSAVPYDNPLFHGSGIWDDPYTIRNVGLLETTRDIRTWLRSVTETISGDGLSKDIDDSVFVLQFHSRAEGEYVASIEFSNDEQDLDLYWAGLDVDGNVVYESESDTEEDTENVTAIADDQVEDWRLIITAFGGWDDGEPSNLTQTDLLLDLSHLSEADADSTYAAGAAAGYSNGDAVGFAVPSAITNLTAERKRIILYDKTLNLQDNTDIIDWWAYFFAPRKLHVGAIMDGIPPATENDTLIIQLQGGDNMKCGQFVFGYAATIGQAQAGDSGI